MTIDWTPIIQTGLETAQEIAVAMTPVVIAAFGVWLRAHMKNQAAADAIIKAVSDAPGAMQQARQKGAIGGAVMQAGVDYVKAVAAPSIARLPDANTDELIGDKVNAQVGLANIATNQAIAASPLPEMPHPLDPVGMPVAAFSPISVSAIGENKP